VINSGVDNKTERSKFMGTWALPNTKEKAQALQELMQKPLKANNKTASKLYDLYGDDGLFDAIADRRTE